MCVRLLMYESNSGEAGRLGSVRELIHARAPPLTRGMALWAGRGGRAADRGHLSNCLRARQIGSLTHAHMHTTHTQTHTYIHVCIFVCVSGRVWVRLCLCVHMHFLYVLYVYMYVYIYTQKTASSVHTAHCFVMCCVCVSSRHTHTQRTTKQCAVKHYSKRCSFLQRVLYLKKSGAEGTS